MRLRHRSVGEDVPGETRASRVGAIRWLRLFCLVAAALLLAFVGVARLYSALASQSDLERFRAARIARGTPPDAAAPDPSPQPDRSLWAERRIAAYEASLKADLGLPLAVLRIPRLGLEVPIWEGIDELTLNRGLGHIPGTVAPGGPGNVGIAGHRDGFFRILKDIATGDEIEIERLDGTDRFVVEKTLIVAPEEVWVLAPTPGARLTLVTCFPFYFTGKAPQRFIVQAAVRTGEEARVATPH